MEKIKKIIDIAAVIVLELLALLAFVCPAVTTTYSLSGSSTAAISTYLADLLGGSSGEAGIIPGICYAALAFLAPIGLLSKQKGTGEYAFLGLAMASTAIGIYAYNGVKDAADLVNTSYYTADIGFGATSILLYAILLLLLVIWHVVYLFLPDILALASKGGSGPSLTERLKELESLKAEGLIDEGEYARLREEAINGKDR